MACYLDEIIARGGTDVVIWGELFSLLCVEQGGVTQIMCHHDGGIKGGKVEGRNGDVVEPYREQQETRKRQKRDMEETWRREEMSSMREVKDGDGRT